MAKKYYWLKLQKDFFKRHDIKIIESMPNGKDYVLFYLKLLAESIDHEGSLRFSDTIPYNEEMLATITNTNVDVVKSATKIFVELEMIEILEDSTIFMAESQKCSDVKQNGQRKSAIIAQVRTMSSVCPHLVHPMSDKR
jgi:predicted phage replisome organizer